MNQPSPGHFRILLVEDSLEEGFLVRALVESEGLGEVVVAQDGVQGAALVHDGTFDLVICDLNLPGRDGVEVIQASQAEYPERPLIVTTGYDDPDVHAHAAGLGADRVLTKPLDKASFLESLWSLLARGMGGDSEPPRTVLAVGAFPGDVESACGGVLAGLVRDNCQAIVLTLTAEVESGIDRAAEAALAARHLGTRLILGGLDRIEMAKVIELVQDAVQHHRPDTLLIPSAHDRSAARLVAHEAALIAGAEVRHVYAYQSPSATLAYRPQVFASVEKVMERKLRALECFGDGPGVGHLDPALAHATARYWSRYSKHPEVEPLELLRSPPPAVRPSAPTDESHSEAA